MNREIAYIGQLGRKRKDFCVRYSQHKEAAIAQMVNKQLEGTASLGESISCHKGCHFCCADLIMSSLQESELIVYHLYQNTQIMDSFLQAYPRWYEKVSKHEDLLEQLGELHNKELDGGVLTPAESERKDDLLNQYWRQQIFCPFLVDRVCSIYGVRPFACASLVVTTPSDWCRPDSVHAKVRMHLSFPSIPEPEFYDDRFQCRYTGIMPGTVYHILAGGYSYLSEITKLQTLAIEVASDPEIQAFFREYGRTRSGLT